MEIKKIKDWLNNYSTDKDKQDYQNWLVLRKQSMNIDGEKLCYCGHTCKCSCADPDVTLFKESVQRGALDKNDPTNNWVTTQ